jgi:2-polyprenyl-3-methyl-5-hydroxy-6-metoxy-1,4-benzoquinol methylase
MSIKDLEKILRTKLESKELSGNINDQTDKLNYGSYNNKTLYQNVQANNEYWDIPVDEKIRSHRKVIGPILIFAKKLVRKLLYWFVTKPLLAQKSFNGSVTRSLNEVYNYINFAEKRNLDLLGKITTLQQELHSLKSENQILYKEVETLKKENLFICEQINTLEAEEEPFTLNYLEFENKFRGSVEATKRRQLEVYLPFLESRKDSLMIDVGCGRGELVEGLTENGFNIIGVDLNEQMVNYCQSKELNVLHLDALEYLKTKDDNSVGVIFSLHVFEHLTPQKIVELLKVFHQKLEKGGEIFIETPNPECLYTLAYGYTIDLTHHRILHPYTMQFLLEEAGFVNVKIKHLSPVSEEVRLKNIDENSFLLNDNINKINNLLFSYQDYVIYATK